ncbi:MAG: hypothetical protein ACE5G8_18375, partial [Anaerolineae bacterium]
MSKTRNWRLVNWRLQIANLQSLLPKKHRLWGEILVIGTAVAVILWFLFLAVNRLAYPYDLDFIEDAMLMQAWRTAVRLPVYLPPNA